LSVLLTSEADDWFNSSLGCSGWSS